LVDYPLHKYASNSLYFDILDIFVVIQRDMRYKDKTYYKLAIANKTGVLPYGPYLHSPPVYEKTEQFRDFLLTKCETFDIDSKMYQ
jgi:hypothetical protein